jgi:hypothetical protein
MVAFLPCPDTIAEWPHRMFCIKCDLCQRYGQYRTVKLVAMFGTGIHPVVVAAQLANCPDARDLMEQRKMGRHSCGLYFPDYVERVNSILPWRYNKSQ